jgi:hypothetical protein
MDTVPTATVIALCAQYGLLLKTPAGVDGVVLMQAIAANESTTGANCKPRYERSYDEGGVNAENEQIPLLEQYGKAAAYSYGPWQMMPCNATGYSPAELYADPEACAQAFVGFFNRYVIGHWKASTVEQIGQVYNHGSPTSHPSPGVQQYVADLVKNYNAIATSQAKEMTT